VRQVGLLVELGVLLCAQAERSYNRTRGDQFEFYQTISNTLKIGEGISPWNVGGLKLLDAAVCPRTLRWVLF